MTRASPTSRSTFSDVSTSTAMDLPFVVIYKFMTETTTCSCPTFPRFDWSTDSVWLVVFFGFTKWAGLGRWALFFNVALHVAQKLSLFGHCALVASLIENDSNLCVHFLSSVNWPAKSPSLHIPVSNNLHICNVSRLPSLLRTLSLVHQRRDHHNMKLWFPGQYLILSMIRNN